MTPELIALTMFGLLLLGLFMGHPLAFVLGGTAVLGAVIAGKPMVLGIVIRLCNVHSSLCAGLLLLEESATLSQEPSRVTPFAEPQFASCKPFPY